MQCRIVAVLPWKHFMSRTPGHLTAMMDVGPAQAFGRMAKQPLFHVVG